MNYDRERLKGALAKLFEACGELRAVFPDPRLNFTPDGHLIGDLGVALAAVHFGVTPLRQATKGCDGVDADGKRVEVKATFGKQVSFRGHEDGRCAERCLVFQLTKEPPHHRVIFNGPTNITSAKLQSRPPSKSNGQRKMSLRALEQLNVDE